MYPLRLFNDCRLCPRSCGVNRLDQAKTSVSGFCGQSHVLKVAYVGPHFGEEPPITGSNGSGTVFFTGCTLKCSFCQNHQISHGGLGRCKDLSQLLGDVEGMIHEKKVHNVNFVTPDHFFPHVFVLVSRLRKRGVDLPTVFNLSGYQSIEILKIAADYADIYLPDYKYSDSSLASRLSKCKDYPRIALDAIGEMVKQRGFLDSCQENGRLAKRGVLVRHLILPGYVENSINALTTLFLEFGRELPLSLMSQYYPALRQEEDCMNRFVSTEEFEKVYSHVLGLGFKHVFVQFPEKGTGQDVSAVAFLPDFRKEEPFC
jgi:putative pyruvate formate lyase activating enzyme